MYVYIYIFISSIYIFYSIVYKYKQRNYTKMNTSTSTGQDNMRNQNLKRDWSRKIRAGFTQTSPRATFGQNNLEQPPLVGGLRHVLFSIYIGNNHPKWLVTRGLETTNQPICFQLLQAICWAILKGPNIPTWEFCMRFQLGNVSGNTKVERWT